MLIHSGAKYLRTIYACGSRQPFTVDVYRVLDAFDVRCPARQHAIKKLLCAGLRDKGSVQQDLDEARDAITEAMELQMNREPRELAGE